MHLIHIGDSRIIPEQADGRPPQAPVLLLHQDLKAPDVHAPIRGQPFPETADPVNERSIHPFVPVENEDPRKPGRGEGDIAGLREVVRPAKAAHYGTEGLGNSRRIIPGSGISDQNLVENPPHAAKAPSQRPGLVPDDHAETDTRSRHPCAS